MYDATHRSQAPPPVGDEGGASTASQHVSGKNATGNNFRNFSGNFYAGNVNLSDSQFFTPNLEDFEPPTWVEPLAAPNLVKSLGRSRILFLAGSLRDRNDCALHLARLFQDRHKGVEGNCVNVRVLVPSSDPVPLERELSERSPALLILRDILPRQIQGQEIVGLLALLERCRGFAIITTACARKDWLIDSQSSLSEAWYDLLWDNFYGKELLAEFLVQQIRARSAGRTSEFLAENSNVPTLANGFPIERSLSRLQGPRAVIDFAHFLTYRGKLPSQKQVEERLRAAGEDSLAVGHWVRQLEPRMKTLLLGLCLLDGLPEDVLFKGLEELVLSSWRRADPQLQQFEYHDLEMFFLYFRQTYSEEDLTRIECSSPAVKKQIIQSLWCQHRRHFISSIATIVALVRNSASGDRDEYFTSDAQSHEEDEAAKDDFATSPSTPELPSRRTNQLHRALVEGLRYFGQISPKAVDPIFFGLANEKDGNVRRFVARTLASWVTHGEEERVVALLTRWWNAASLLSQRRIDEEGSVEVERRPSYRMRTTIALTVGFMASLYPANRLPLPLLHIISELVEDSSKVVRQAVELVLLPLALEHHLDQIDSLILNGTKFPQDLVLSLALGAAWATARRPDEGDRILKRWKARGKDLPPSPSRQLAAERERVLAAFAAALGFVALTPCAEAIAFSNVYREFRALLLEEWHPFVRSHVFSSMELQAGRHFDAVSLLLVQIVSKVQLSERSNVTEVLTRIYLEQRRTLKGGQRTAVLNGDVYSLWLSRNRPMTGIEKTMMAWSLDSTYPAAQQIALEAFIAFGESELERTERKYRTTEAPQAELSSAPWSLAPENEVFGLPFWGAAALSLATLGKTTTKDLVSALFAEWLAIDRSEVNITEGSMPIDLRDFGLISSTNRLQYLRWRLKSNPFEAAAEALGALGSALQLYRLRWVPPVLLAILAFWVWKH